ncbi:hypothetical protein [Bradyrhizobium sp.]|nr:hypothetical protein [Bradyrhizobium sp.]
MAFWLGGLLSATFALNWMRAVAVFAGLEDRFLLMPINYGARSCRPSL